MGQLSTALSQSYARIVAGDSAAAFFKEVAHRAHNQPLLVQQSTKCSQETLALKLASATDTLINYAIGNMTELEFEQRARQFVEGTPAKVDLEICLAWQACLLQVVEAYDERFNNDLKQAWTEILAPGIKRLTM